MLQNFKLVKKINLTYDIFEISFESEKNIDMKPWQFITFLLDNIWWRAYSILEIIDKKIILIIKKWELNNWWRWWSKLICELNIWDCIKWIWPAGHFLLQKNIKNKLFLWTWTWFVPLYNQIKANIEQKIQNNIKLIFWVRTLKNLFYIKELKKMKQKNKNFDFEIYLSREKINNYNNWYVTDFLTKNNIDNFEEFYICWTASMISSSQNTLKQNWKKNIFYEKY